MININSIINEIIKPLLHEDNVVEAKNIGVLYHFTNFNGLSSILDSNTFKGSEANVDKDDLDFKSFKMDAEKLKSKGIYTLYFFSTTRDKLIYKKDPKIKGSTVRIVLDGDKLSNKFQISPFYYYHDEMIDEPNPKYSQDESEERIVLGTKKVISDALDYIKEIDILLDKIEDNQEYLDTIQRLIEKYGDKIKCLYKEKPMSLDTYIKTILPTIEPFRYKEEDILEQQESQTVSNNFDEALKSLTQYMIDQGMNIEPLPRVISISNDSKNAENILGKTAHYTPSNCSITLYTLNRHPKDILRSYSHEMIHRMQDNEGRLKDINTTNTNEDDSLEELEKEAYLKGNITFRNWEDSLKNNINEWIVDIPKYNYAPKLSNKIFSQLHELKINEITLNSNNAVEVYGDLNNGDFTVGEYDYNYRIIKLDKNPYNSNSFYNIDFHEIGNKNPNPSTPTGNAKENYIKILSTMYKIILDFTQDESPEYVGISSLDESGYWNVYNNLIKTNQIPGYSRKDVGLQFKDKDGKNGKFIILKRTDV
jgi:hypothetical protein